MKNQYFGDRRDVAKYDLLAEMLDHLPGLRRLSLLLMMTGNDTSRDGSLVAKTRPPWRGDVYWFARRCREIGGLGVGELRTFFRSSHPKHDVYLLDKPYSHAGRHRYFGAVPGVALKDSAVFLDPDVGMSLKEPAAEEADKYLDPADAGRLLRRMRGNSVLVVYQHLQHNADLRAEDAGERARALFQNCGAKQVVILRRGDVAFLLVARIPSRELVAWAHDHGLSRGFETTTVGGPQWWPMCGPAQGRTLSNRAARLLVASGASLIDDAPDVGRCSDAAWLCAVPEVLRRVALDHFRVTKRIDSIRLPDVPGIQKGRLLRLAGMTIIHGSHGSGRTSILGFIAKRAGAVRRLGKAPDDRPELNTLAAGEQIMAVERILLDALPRDGCLLVDDALGHLDLENVRKFVAALAASRKQVVMTTTTRLVPHLRSILGPKVRIVDVAELAGWDEAAKPASQRP
jgi:hypothetical protein